VGRSGNAERGAKERPAAERREGSEGGWWHKEVSPASLQSTSHASALKEYPSCLEGTRCRTRCVSAHVDRGWCPTAVDVRTGAGGRAARCARRRGAATATRRPPLFFREEWKQTPAGGEQPVTPESIASANLELKLYGPSSKEIQLTGVANDENNPIHVWTGNCTSPCAVAFRDKTNPTS
jgi:hypothetical protein